MQQDLRPGNQGFRDQLAVKPLVATLRNNLESGIEVAQRPLDSNKCVCYIVHCLFMLAHIML